MVDIVSKEWMLDSWSNQHHRDSKFLDLRIKNKGVSYEINIPPGYFTEVIPLSGTITTPKTNR